MNEKPLWTSQFEPSYEDKDKILRLKQKALLHFKEHCPQSSLENTYFWVILFDVDSLLLKLADNRRQTSGQDRKPVIFFVNISLFRGPRTFESYWTAPRDSCRLDAALHDYKLLKQNMSAGFAEPYRSLKCDFYAAGAGGAGDPASLKLASPELERLIGGGGGGGVITSPSTGACTGAGAAPVQQHVYARTIAEDQECFADGFVKALDELHKMNHVPPPNVALGGAGGGSSCAGAPVFPDAPVYATLNSCHPNTTLPPAASYPTATISYLPQYHHHHQHQHHHHQPHHFQHAARLAGLKEEPQTVPDLQGDSSPPTSPVDMEDQERMKAERKRLRNRLAATKCRRRKLERISRLEDKVKVLKSDNAGLSSAATLLREQVAQLKQKVMTHVSSGCQLMLAPKVKTY
ncbi:hypothetical protein MHYP_G00098720 [Metynnis hypsauchen]